MKNYYLFFLLFFYGLSSTYAQSKRAEDFSLPDAVSGETVTLSEFQNSKAIVILFTSNFCPYSKLYETRFASLVKNYKDKGVSFIMINPNDPGESKDDSMEAMKAKAKEWGLNIPYLADKDQKVAAAFGASKTPEVFVLSNKPSRLTIVYSGALDDNPQVAEDTNQNYLKQALDAILQGKIVNIPHKRPVGCMIKIRN